MDEMMERIVNAELEALNTKFSNGKGTVKDFIGSLVEGVIEEVVAGVESKIQEAIAPLAEKIPELLGG